MILSLFSLLATTGFAAPQQTPATLADYLANHPVPGSLVVGAEKRGPLDAGAELARYNRKAVKVGGVTAIVPLQMVEFADAPKQAPNLYDGLPRDAKVLYLLSTLNEGQWQKLGGQGLGLDQLKGEQRDVFVSLLPQNFRWARYQVGESRQIGNPLEEGTLDPSQRARVRLRVEPRVQFLFPKIGEQRTYTATTADREAGQPGESVTRRDESEDRNPTETYGVAVRATVPNQPKKGQLDTNALSQSVRLPAKSSIGEALARIGAATGKEILADARVRSLSVSCSLDQARAGDLLAAIALAVEGTYRKVDSAYLLVPDVQGVGARKLRFTLWKEELDAALERHKSEWRTTIAGSGLAKYARIDPNDPIQAGSAVERRLGKPPVDSGEIDFFPAAELTDSQRAFLDRIRRDYNGFHLDKVGVESVLAYRFVLPDGTATQREGSLGMDWEFKPLPLAKPLSPDPSVPKQALLPKAGFPLCVSLSSTAEAARAVSLARTFGFAELWVEADQPEVLAAAVDTKFPVRLVVRPWKVRSGGHPDRTILGATSTEAVAEASSGALRTSLERMIRLQTWPRALPWFHSDVRSPWDPEFPAVKDRLGRLSRVPGLAGVVLLETQPHGYEEVDDTAQYGAYVRSINEAWAVGYDERARLAFFRDKGVDPVDLTSEMIRFDVDLYTPFFPRYPAAPLTSTDQLRSDWTRFLAMANQKAIRELRDTLPDIPVLCEVRSRLFSLPPWSFRAVREWSRNAEPPSEAAYYVTLQPRDFRLISSPSPKAVERMTDFGNMVKVFAKEPRGSATTVDLFSVPSSRWEEWLERWLSRM